MAKRPSVKEILEAARRGGPAKPAGEEASSAPEAEASQPAAVAPARPASKPAAPAANVPTPSQLGRPLTVKEKLAAARAGAGGAAPAAAPAAEAADADEPAAAPAAPAVPVDIPTPEKLGRPLTVKEKLAAARAGAAAAAPAAGGAKPAAAKPASAAPKAAPKKELPPLSEISDPKDLAEALRQTASKKEQEEAAARAKAAPAKPAKEKEKKPETVLPRPGRGTAASAAGASAETRRAFWRSAAALLWLAWGSFTFGVTTFTVMLVRFMFPNVLAEPPSTIKIGLPNAYETEAVNERFKAEWGFWVVRSTRYDGQDIIYALKSVCTHLGCPPNWLAGEQKFKCPCHGSGFYISGVNFEGPAPRPLERFKVTLADDGQIVVDKSQIFQQELGQWSDPDSFITA
ncbi:MAG: ubiquinol-cytochrome c reductase iron-sulfur subunit [Isosphaeraceae bacterium]